MNFKKSEHNALWGSESWEISVHPSDPSVIDGGERKGATLREVYPKFPLLFKVIDAKKRLSVQVHPNEETCKVTGGGPKTEMWCALSDGPIYAGLKVGTSAADVGADGQPRELHIEKGLQAIDYSLPVPIPCKSLDTPFFKFSQERVLGASILSARVDEFLALYTAKGEIDLDGKRVMERTSVLIPPSSTCELFGSDSVLFETRFKG